MIAGIYLAAGKSTRMGRSKLNLPADGEPLGGIALRRAMESSLDRILVVTQAGDPLDWVADVMFEPPYSSRWIPIQCETAHQGAAESLKSGLKAAMEADASAILVLLADQPFVTAGMIDHLINCYLNANIKFVSAVYEGVARPPVLFDRRMFPDLLRLQGDEGARRLIRSGAAASGMLVEWNDPNCFIDIDTRADYTLFFGRPKDGK